MIDVLYENKTRKRKIFILVRNGNNTIFNIWPNCYSSNGEEHTSPLLFVKSLGEINNLQEKVENSDFSNRERIERSSLWIPTFAQGIGRGFAQNFSFSVALE